MRGGRLRSTDDIVNPRTSPTEKHNEQWCEIRRFFVIVLICLLRCLNKVDCGQSDL